MLDASKHDVTFICHDPSQIYGLHLALDSHFGPRAESGYLWALTEREGVPAVVARRPVDWQGKAGDMADFELTATVTKARKDGKGRCARHPLDIEGRKAWLERRGREHGFSVENVEVNPSRRWIERKGKRFYIDATTFRGRIRITDPELFSQAHRSGLGNCRAWGCGMLLIRNLESEGED